jgi:3-hydroxyacyl-[acyl-carrier-protein] dehydratase
MRFLMVDRICELNRGRSARGLKNLSWNDDFIEEIFPGIHVLSPVIAAEAVAQLLSWVIIEHRDFTVKPVITMVDSFICSGQVIPGDRLVLEGEIESFSEDSALANGRVLLNGKPVVELNHAVCYFYPLDKLDPPERARTQFENLYEEGSPLPQISTRNKACLIPGAAQPNKKKWIDRIIDSDEPERIQGIKNVTATEDFFNDHFPLKPVLPGVLIIESMVSLAKILIDKVLAGQNLSLKKPVLRSVKKIKFRKFVKPGDQLFINAEISEFSPDKSLIKAKAKVNGNTVSAAFIELDLLDREVYENMFL